MKKTIEIESNYFEDSRIKALIDDMQMMGLGIYFMIRIILDAQENNGGLPMDYILKTVCHNSRRNRCLQVIRNYSLFTVDDFGLIRACALAPACAPPACAPPACASPACASPICVSPASITTTNSKDNNNLELEKDIVVVEQKRFRKPTIEEISAYCTERQNGIDAEHFFHYYESKGWKIGKETMKNWKSAMITWERKRKEQMGNASNNSRDARPCVSQQGSMSDPSQYNTYEKPTIVNCQQIPPDAPPKPSPNAQWDFATDSWNEFY